MAMVTMAATTMAMTTAKPETHVGDGGHADGDDGAHASAKAVDGFRRARARPTRGRARRACV
eukprot:9493903-Pyramimonas_sp.AAC.1